MSPRDAFRSHRTIPLPENIPESATARGKQKEGDKEEDERPSSPPLPRVRPPVPIPRVSPPLLPSRIIPLRRQLSIHDLAEAASSRRARTSSIPARTSSVPAREDPFADMKQNYDREELCTKAAKMVWDDLSQVLIWPMNDIDQSDDAMCERVTDLLGPDLRGEVVVLGKPFIAESFDGMSIIEDRRVCGVLVATEKNNPAKVRVADLANLKPQTGKYAVGYGEFDVASQKLFGSHVMIVKRGQQVVIEGKIKLRFFLRVVTGSDNHYIRMINENAWNFKKSVFDASGPLWHEYFTKKRR